MTALDVVRTSIVAGMLGLAPVVALGQGHEGHGTQQPEPAAPQDHSAHRAQPAEKSYPPFIQPITDEDRAAAFPPLNGQHTVHDDGVNYFVLVDQLELQAGDETGGGWEASGWVGKDVNRFWFRTEGEGGGGDLETAHLHALFGRAVHRWWDVVAGVRQDFRPGAARMWAAVGIQGLAPYWFEVEATAYIGESARTHFRVETEYEFLLTNRLILQPLVELEIYGKSDQERGIGAGLSSAEAGLRLRYELRRELAPYVGLAWDRKFFGTADLAEAAGDEIGGARLALGIRAWF